MTRSALRPRKAETPGASRQGAEHSSERVGGQPLWAHEQQLQPPRLEVHQSLRYLPRAPAQRPRHGRRPHLQQ
eukprot:CAMPEP_0171958108 /NCGR_PEP_ID=MMETSP0993-20121228/137080_1 /TAXON_ID=483369 /ORGANISM="non described non described, Strain CCMP2098" /LENGTH=72 /DNA_ID=CAMNT_0012605223 /DNA_START=36 /DNA_END=252 /DNA_ORIENTATION=-